MASKENLITSIILCHSKAFNNVIFISLINYPPPTIALYYLKITTEFISIKVHCFALFIIPSINLSSKFLSSVVDVCDYNISFKRCSSSSPDSHDLDKKWRGGQAKVERWGCGKATGVLARAR